MQQVHINLDAKDDDEHISKLKDFARNRKLIRIYDELYLDMLQSMMKSGKSGIVLYGHTNDEVVSILASSANFLRMAGAVRGRMAALGEINTGVNPPMTIAPIKDKKIVSLILELPMQELNYTREEAEKLVYYLGKAVRQI